MESGGSVTHWLRALRSGNRAAAQQLWEGYFERLVRLARGRLRNGRRRVADEEDVALSAFDSFCRGAEQGRFPRLENRDDLWQLLVMLTVRKALNLLAHQGRHKRGGGLVRGESVFGESDQAGIEQIVGDEPNPEFAAQVSDECSRLLGCLDAELRLVAQCKLEGFTNSEIAERLGCAPATVERRLRLIRSIWSQEHGG